VVAVEPARAVGVLERAAARGVPAVRLGRATGDRLMAPRAFDIAVADAATAWRDAVPGLLGRTSLPERA
jgi:hypothetical protein